MNDETLLVFAGKRSGPPLRRVQEALREAGAPAEIGVEIAGPATEAQLAAEDWDAAFLRWKNPQIHEIAMFERAVSGEDEQADTQVAEAAERIRMHGDATGRLIVLDQLRNTQTVFLITLLPALLADDDHPAWAVLDTALRCVAAEAEGLIYAPQEGYYDPDGELILAELEEHGAQQPAV